MKIVIVTNSRSAKAAQDSYPNHEVKFMIGNDKEIKEARSNLIKEGHEVFIYNTSYTPPYPFRNTVGMLSSSRSNALPLGV